MSEPRSQTANVDVFLILRRRGGEVLFGLRGSQQFAPHTWNLVSGKADEGEDVVTAMLREAREEAGIVLSHEDLTPAGVVHYLNDEQPRVGFGFLAEYNESRHGPIVNAEPHKCDELRWASPDAPPSPLEHYNAAVLGLISGADRFTIHGRPRGEG